MAIGTRKLLAVSDKAVQHVVRKCVARLSANRVFTLCGEIVPPRLDITGSRRRRNDYPWPFRGGEGHAVKLAQLSPPVGVAVKHGDDRLAERCGERAYAPHFMIGNRKGAGGGRGVQRA